MARFRLLLLVCLAGCASTRAPESSSPPATTPVAPADSPAAEAIIIEDIKAHLEFLAADAQEGRPPGTDADGRVQSYVETVMRAAGLKPGFDGGFRQSFAVTDGVRTRSGTVTNLTVGTRAIVHDLLPFSRDTSDTGPIKAPLVFVGYGLVADGAGTRDYAGLKKAVKGAIVVVLAGGPEDPHIDIAQRRAQSKAITARDHGAAGMILWDPGASTPFPNHGEATDLGLPAVFVGVAGTPVLLESLVGAAKAKQILAKDAGNDNVLATLRRGTKGRTKAELFSPIERVQLKTANVAGLIPGTNHDHEIVLGAHMDHLGWGTASSLAPGEHSVHNGADDNASGVAVMLEVCRAIAQLDAAQRPFDVRCVAFGAEEMGVLGSKHFVAQLDKTRRDRIAAMINFDMVGRLGPDGLVVAGSGTATQWPELLAKTKGQLAVRTTEDGYGPSDHASFYEAEIPVLHFFTGPHEDYHRPSDDVAKINFEGAASIGKMALAVVEQLQQRAELPTYVAVARAEPRAAGGFRVSLGTVPDYGAKVDGLRLSGVRDGGAADEAGLRRGDVITKIGDREIHNIDDYMASFGEMKPGQAVVVVVQRDGGTVELSMVPKAPKPH